MEEIKDIENTLKNIHTTFDPGKKCLGKDWRINFQEEELKLFVTQLSLDDRKFLARLISFFWYYMKPLYRLLNDEGSLEEFLGNNAWSTFSLVIIMSVLDKYTQKHAYKRKKFTEFLSENVPITSKEELRKLSNQYRTDNPHTTIKRFSELFKNNLDAKEIEMIVADYMSERQNEGNLKVASIEEVFGHLWGDIRTGFIHYTGIDSIYNESTMFTQSKDRPDVIVVNRNLSMRHFLYLSWKAIFRDLGYTGEMNNKFTGDEMRNKVTVDGTKL